MNVLFRIAAVFRPSLLQRIQVRVIARDPFRVSMDMWRSNPDLVMAAQKAMADPTVRMMLDVLRTEHLGRMTLMVGDLEARALQQCRAEGYGIALNNFEALGNYEKPKEDLQATFEDPDLTED